MNAVFRLIESPKFTVRSWFAVSGGYVDARGHVDYQAEVTAKSSHGDTVKMAFVELLPFHFSLPKMLHIKPVYLGLVFSWHSVVVLLGVCLVWWALEHEEQSLLSAAAGPCMTTVLVPFLVGFLSSRATNVIKAASSVASSPVPFNCLWCLRCFYNAILMPAVAEECSCRVSLGLLWSPKTFWLLSCCSKRTNSSLCTLQNEVRVSCRVVSRSWTRELGWSQGLKNVACA